MCALIVWSSGSLASMLALWWVSESMRRRRCCGRQELFGGAAPSDRGARLCRHERTGFDGVTDVIACSLFEVAFITVAFLS
eukprot:9110383-Pyramimonas_sp.AAC.1